MARSLCIKVEEKNDKTYLYTLVDDWSGVHPRFRKDVNSFVVFDSRSVGHWLFLEEENVLHEDFDFTLEGVCGHLNPYSADLVYKSGRGELIVDADGVVIGVR